MSDRPVPTWTWARLALALGLRFGVTSHGRPDTAAVAQGLGVSRRTVQRWLHGGDGASIAPLPEQRQSEVIAALAPPPAQLRAEQVATRYATRAIDAIALGRGRGILPAWTEQGWLEDHLVAVLEIPDSGIRQLVVGQSHLTKLDEIRRRGSVVDVAVVPTRFHATILVNTVLDQLHNFRLHAGPGQVKAGFTQAWLADAPATHLSRLADEITRRHP